MVLSTEWSQVEVIDLINDGNGLGFILVGGRSTGVVIKYLAPGGVAEKDGRLQCGDHLLQIGEVNLRGFSSEQVATVLRQTGAQVRLIVARPVEPTSTDFHELASHAPIIPTKLLSDPEELSRHLFHNPSFATSTSSVGVGSTFACNSTTPILDSTVITTALPSAETAGDCFLSTPDTELADLPLPPIPSDLPTSAARNFPKDLDIIPISIVSPPPLPSLSKSAVGTPVTAMGLNANVDHIETVITGDYATTSSPALLNLEDVEIDCLSDTSSNYIESPETETYQVRLRKNVYGLGITVAGYVCQEEDLSGIFVKSIIEGSAAEMSKQIQINDRIVAVDGRTLAGVTNHQAVEILRNTDIEVVLTLERFLRGRKYEHLQVALTEIKGDSQSQLSLPPSPSIATLSWLPPKSDADSIITDGGGELIESFPELPSRDTVESNMSNMLDKSYSNSLDRFVVTPTTPERKLLTNGSPSDGKIIKDLQDVEKEKAKLPVTQNQKQYQKNQYPTKQFNGSTTAIIGEDQKNSSIAKTVPTTKSVTAVVKSNLVKTSPSSPNGESSKVTWKSEFPESEIIVAEISKLSGLGISLEGTVDVECGIEKRPHHYIRSILEDGPVGKQGILKPGDEILQVNEHKLQGLKHTEVVRILKELPTHVKLVCARGPTAPSVINTSQNPEAFETRSILPGGVQSLQNLLSKAQSESSLYTSSTATLTDQQRSKSLENVSGLALWCSDVTTIEIEKTDQGFGFSILDYQDPMDPEGTVIVIRGLIRGGAAEATNEVFPGDRLVSVGDHCLQGLELDEAVHILKGMPSGKTKLGICRPLSTSDSNSNIASPIAEGDSPSA